MKRLIALLATTTLALTLTACSTTPGLKPNGHTTGASKTATPKSAKPAEAAKAATATPTEVPISLMFGETYTTPLGVSITVSAPAPYTPADASHAEPAAAYVQFKFSIKNSSQYDLGFTFGYDAKIAVNSQGTEGKAVANPDPTKSTIDDNTPAGGTTEFTVGYGVADPAQVTLTITLGEREPKVIFTT